MPGVFLAVTAQGTSDLGMTFFNIIRCGGLVAFIIGYAEFISSFQGSDLSSLLPHGKKMFAGLVLANVKYFLKLCKVWKHINTGTAVSGVVEITNLICNCCLIVVTGTGVIGLILSVQRFADAISQKDMPSVRQNIMSLFVSVLVLGIGAVLTTLELVG